MQATVTKFRRGHRFFQPKGVAVTFCKSCGHVPLSNAISQYVTKLGCDYEDDARFKAWKKNPKAGV